MNETQYVCLFARASGARLLAAERLACSLPQLLGPALVECHLLFGTASRDLVMELRLAEEGGGEPVQSRLAFWTARAGGRALTVKGLGEGDRRAFQRHVEGCELKRMAVRPGELFEVAGDFFTEAGAPSTRRRSAVDRPMLVIEVGGPGWDGVAFEPFLRELFLPSPMAPPVGDEVLLVVRAPGAQKPIGVRARVGGRRSPQEAGPGRPSGFSLRIPDSAPFILALLERHSPGSTAGGRGAPRYAIRSPVTVEPGGPAPAGATISYATDRELKAAYVENLSQGGAFVRTGAPLPAGSPLALRFRLPNGAELKAEAVVAYVNRDGMGVRFTLDAEGEATLQAAMAHLTASPRRAMVADDDGPFRLRLAEALAERGFEVATASLTGDGLRLVSEELRGLDLLLTGATLPGRGGEAFVRTLRAAGGEADPAIVICTQKMDLELERSFEAAGADAVLDKALGPELAAQAADAALERKRASR